MKKLIKTIRYLTFLRFAAHIKMTREGLRNYIKENLQNRQKGQDVDKDFFALVPEIWEADFSDEKKLTRRLNDVYTDLSNAFPVISEGENQVLQCNDLLYRPLLLASNEALYCQCRKREKPITFYREFTGIENLTLYPIHWVREGGANFLVCFEEIEKDDQEGLAYHLFLLDMSENLLLVECPSKTSDFKVPHVVPQFYDALDRFVQNDLKRTGEPYYRALLEIKGEYKVFNRQIAKINYDTLYKIGISDVEKGGGALTWDTDLEHSNAILYFYADECQLRESSIGWWHFSVSFIPALLVRGKCRNVYSFFNTMNSRLEEELENIFDGCHLPLRYFKEAQPDDTEEHHLRHRNDSTEYIIVGDLLKRIYERATRKQVTEEVYEVPDSAVAAGFLGTGTNENGRLCVYWRKVKTGKNKGN